VARDIFIAFVGPGGKNPFAGRRAPGTAPIVVALGGGGRMEEPRGSELDQFALVVADYR